MWFYDTILSMEKSPVIYSTVQGKYKQNLKFTTWKFLIGLPPESWMFSGEDPKNNFKKNVIGQP